MPQLRYRRRGSMYLMVLGTAMAVMTIGLASILVVRVDRRAAEQATDFQEARLYAQSAVEVGTWITEHEPTWRTSRSQGSWKKDERIGRGTYSLTATDGDCNGVGDADFANNREHHVCFTGTGVAGPSLYNLAVEMAPYGPPGMDSLASAIHTKTLVTVNNTVTLNAPLSSNFSISISAGRTVNGDVAAVNLVTNLGTVTGTISQGIAAKEMPASTVFDYYIAQAVEIPLASIPMVFGVPTISDKVISPGSNPVGGPLHAKGMYLIRCNGSPISVKRTRLYGTLIILDSSVGSDISGTVNFEPFDSALPTLMVRGNIDFKWTGNLIESTSPATNFNPAGSPYAGGTDIDTTDTYPGTMKGLIYVSGVLSTQAAESINGVLLTAGTSFTNLQPLTITHDPNLINAPPPGFEKAYRPMVPVAGTWKRVVN